MGEGQECQLTQITYGVLASMPEDLAASKTNTHGLGRKSYKRNSLKIPQRNDQRILNRPYLNTLHFQSRTGLKLCKAHFPTLSWTLKNRCSSSPSAQCPAGEYPTAEYPLACPAEQYPCSAQPQNILAVPQSPTACQTSECQAVPKRRVPAEPTAHFPAVPKRKISLWCQPHNIPVAHNGRVCRQCPTANYHCSAGPQSIPVPNPNYPWVPCSAQVFPCSAQPRDIPGCPTSNHNHDKSQPHTNHPEGRFWSMCSCSVCSWQHMSGLHC